MSAETSSYEEFGPPAGARRIGRYRLLGLLATGGMAEIYLAVSGELSGFRTLVVVKRILPRLSSNRQFIDMFFDEARLAAQLDHPNIVRIIEVGQDRDEYFLAMEVVQGKHLSALLRRATKRRSPLSHAQVAYLVAQAANGLGYAHNLLDNQGRPLNVVHRDVSPQNILVSFEGAVKVIDFGVARALGRITETVPGGLKGKIHYMAPEQVSAGEVDRRSDVFALGIVLWEALCGRRLFRRDSELETLRAIVQEATPRPSSVVPIPARLDAIVMRALAKDPIRRFQSAAEMALALERHAFASADFNPSQLATRMKGLFPGDHRRWRATVAATTDLVDLPDGWKNAVGTFFRPESIDLETHAPTIRPRRGLPPGTPVRVPPSHEPSSDGDLDGALSTSASWTSRSPPPLPPPPPIKWRPDRPRALAMAGGMIVAVLLGGAWAVISRGRGGPLATTSPAIDPAPPATTISPVISPLLPDLTRLPDAGGAPSGSDPSRVVSPTPDAEPVPLAPTPPAPTPATAAASPAAAKVTGGAHRSKASSKHRSVHRRGGTAAQQVATGCSVLLGSQPWAEIWIDGKSTGQHTPYLEPMKCGTHRVAFIRPDLGLTRTITITVQAGQPFRKILRLAD